MKQILGTAYLWRPEAVVLYERLETSHTPLGEPSLLLESAHLHKQAQLVGLHSATGSHGLFGGGACSRE